MYERLAEVYDEIVAEPDYPRLARFIHDAWSVDTALVSTVLDVCCGTGLLTAELISLGDVVTGTDGSPSMLARARTRLGPDVPLIEAVLPSLPLDGVFDAVVCTFDSLNYLPLDDCRASLAAIGARLRPGGWLVLDVHTVDLMHAIAAHPVSEGTQDGVTFRIVNTVDAEARICDTTADIAPADGTRPFTEIHRQYFFTESEMRAALEDAGFDVLSVTDDYGSDPVTTATLNSTWVARR